jgi:hypothetical protein
MDKCGDGIKELAGLLCSMTWGNILLISLLVYYAVGSSVNLSPNSFFLLRSLVCNVVESLMTKTTQNSKSPTPFRSRKFQTTFLSYLPKIFQQYQECVQIP